MKALVGILVFASAMAGWNASAAQERNWKRVHQLKDLKVVKVTAAGHAISSWVMDNDNKRQEGLMFVTDKEMRADQGALFLFPYVQAGKDYYFWMHNTLIPLDIVYIDKSQKVINVGVGKPKNDTPVRSDKPYFYVLELKGGTCKKLGIKPGTKMEIPSDVKSVD